MKYELKELSRIIIENIKKQQSDYKDIGWKAFNNGLAVASHVVIVTIDDLISAIESTTREEKKNVRFSGCNEPPSSLSI